MARPLCALALLAGVLLSVYGLEAETPEENAGAVFVSPQAAHAVLRRQRRFNSHIEEIMHKDNLERECREETCNMEEAREVFENDEKTMEFWVGYIDGDQCEPRPCQNGGVCEDSIGSYICWCSANFNGKNCEIEMNKQCSVDNGGCDHFCVMQTHQAVCQCAAGYQLGPDKRSCQSTGAFSCGYVNLPSKANTRSFGPRSFNLSDDVQTLFDDVNDTQLYDYYDLSLNDSDPSDLPVASVVDVRSAKSDPSSAINPAQVGTNSSEVSGAAEEPQLPRWAFFPTLPTIIAKENTEKRIVGGEDATPGEIPWQVTLMSHSTSLGRAQPFCGGSLLSEFWVITAAHCLVQPDVIQRGFFVRVGEHDVEKDEGPERDHVVAEQHIHHMYNASNSLFNHDIALLKFASPVELSTQRRPICLGPKDFTENILREASSSLVSGWGRRFDMGQEATKLQKLEVPYVDRTVCKGSSQYQVTRFMFCAGYDSIKKDSCQGDSGGPHATNHKGTWFLTGIVSWGEMCAQEKKYGIYTRVSRYYLWIAQKTGLRISPR